MCPTLQELGIDRLSAEDRLALAEAIWESVAREMEQDPPTEGQRKELERRLADSNARPDAVTPWEVIKPRALARALMTPAHRIDAVLAEDGKLLLNNLPFRAGQAVEVIVLPASRPVPPSHA